MKSKIAFLILVAFAIVNSAKSQKPVIVSDTMTGFTMQSVQGKTISLADFKGKNVILYFYPKDNTPGCSLEAMMFTKYKPEFEKENTTIIGVSKDSCESHQKFIENKNLNLTLLSDPEKDVQKLYGVWRMKRFMGKEFLGTVRTTFLIDEKGIIRKIWDKVKVKESVKKL